MNDSFKASIRVPTTEPYAYLEIEAEGSPEAILEAYERFNSLVKRGKGLEAKEYDKFIERQLLGETNVLEQYNAMSEDQQRTVQIIKRALKRIGTRE